MNYHQLTEVKADLVQPVNKLTKYDVILIVAVIIISTSLIVFNFFINKANATGFEIYVDGKLHSTYSFSSLENGSEFTIQTEYGYNKFLYENNSIRCTDTNCKDKLELKVGTIKNANQVIVCVPHKLIVQIVGKTKIDKVSY